MIADRAKRLTASDYRDGITRSFNTVKHKECGRFVSITSPDTIRQAQEYYEYARRPLKVDCQEPRFLCCFSEFFEGDHASVRTLHLLYNLRVMEINLPLFDGRCVEVKVEAKLGEGAVL